MLKQMLTSTLSFGYSIQMERKPNIMKKFTKILNQKLSSIPQNNTSF